MTMITPSYLGETIEYSSLHACRSTLEDPTFKSLETSMFSDRDNEDYLCHAWTTSVDLGCFSHFNSNLQRQKDDCRHRHGQLAALAEHNVSNRCRFAQLQVCLSVFVTQL